MLTIKEINNKDEWEGFLRSGRVKNVSFFQSWNWGEVQNKLRNPIKRLGFYRKNTLIGLCLVIEVRARRGHYLHLRHGPVLTNFLQDFDEVFHYIVDFAKERDCDFIRMSPLIEERVVDYTFFRQKGLRNAPIHNMDAENAWILDIDKTEKDLLRGMRKTTRYLIKKGLAMPIVVRVGSAVEDFKTFMKLYIQTSKRHQFVPHKGIEEEFNIFSQDGEASLFTAVYKKQIIASAMIIFYGQQAIYHHGASDENFRNIPGAYVVQLKAIQEAKKRGIPVYNFWGVVPESKPNHPWKGLTLFKMGFGGRRINYIHAQDLPLKQSYWKTYLIEYITKLRKRY